MNSEYRDYSSKRQTHFLSIFLPFTRHEFPFLFNISYIFLLLEVAEVQMGTGQAGMPNEHDKATGVTFLLPYS